MKGSRVSAVKGFRDVLPPASSRRERLVAAACEVLERYAYARIELPLLEKGELFERSVGATSDIVEKEMYAFTDKDREGTLLALRPEGTASVVRAYIDAGADREMPVARLYYTGPMFRRERPQKGRLRQFHQIGAELLGREDPAADAETLRLVHDICAATRLREPTISVNSLGDPACRPGYRAALAEYARARVDRLCGDCKERIDRNPLRLLDCKKEDCREAMRDAPMMESHLCTPCREHFDQVLRLAEAADVSFERNPRMVRGLDYYCRTAFEVTARGLGAQDAVGGGGRYDGLVEMLGGPKVAGVGFAFGVERIELASVEGPDGNEGAELFIAPVGEEAEGPALALASKLRAAGARVDADSATRKLKALMKRADRSGARFVVIIGPDELASGRPTVRDMLHKADRAGCFALDDPGEAILAAVRKAGNP